MKIYKNQSFSSFNGLNLILFLILMEKSKLKFIKTSFLPIYQLPKLAPIRCSVLDEFGIRINIQNYQAASMMIQHSI